MLLQFIVALLFAFMAGMLFKLFIDKLDSKENDCLSILGFCLAAILGAVVFVLMGLGYIK